MFPGIGRTAIRDLAHAVHPIGPAPSVERSVGKPNHDQDQDLIWMLRTQTRDQVTREKTGAPQGRARA